jgi:hypothetical protein
MKMKILKWALMILVLLAVLILAFLFYMGFFSDLNVTEKEVGPYTIMYERFVGPYKDTGPIFEKVNAAAKKEGLTAIDGIGIYYDNPQLVVADQLRSDCGIVIEEKDLAKVPSLQKKYKVMTLPKKMCIVAEFPIRNTLSYMFGPMKAYPTLTAYAKKKALKPALTYEFYDMRKNKIYFVMGLKK